MSLGQERVDSRDEETRSTGEHSRLQRFGSSMYGGRPTFALVRREGPEGATLALYELLPREQADARRERMERVGRSLVVSELDDVFDASTSDTLAGWSWTNWVALKVARLSGSRLNSVTPLLREALAEADLDASVVARTGSGNLFLPETVGVRFALAFAGIKPIQRVDRMRAFARGIARMSAEECYYWHAKCRSPSSPNGEKALRTLLTDHIN